MSIVLSIMCLLVLLLLRLGLGLGLGLSLPLHGLLLHHLHLLLLKVWRTCKLNMLATSLCCLFLHAAPHLLLLLHQDAHLLNSAQLRLYRLHMRVRSVVPLVEARRWWRECWLESGVVLRLVSLLRLFHAANRKVAA